jgi:2-keto-4-pentenoate hydratase/2-oxohepta-3-ene-1,7-dioic acid hydratase in catechol pathway
MSVTPAQQMEAITAWAPVQVGDLLFTGTPQGVGELLPDDLVEAKLTDGNGNILSEITVRCD